MTAPDDPRLAAEQRRAQRLLRWVIGGVILLNLLILLKVCWPG